MLRIVSWHSARFIAGIQIVLAHFPTDVNLVPGCCGPLHVAIEKAGKPERPRKGKRLLAPSGRSALTPKPFHSIIVLNCFGVRLGEAQAAAEAGRHGILVGVQAGAASTTTCARWSRCTTTSPASPGWCRATWTPPPARTTSPRSRWGRTPLHPSGGRACECVPVRVTDKLGRPPVPEILTVVPEMSRNARPENTGLLCQSIT